MTITTRGNNTLDHVYSNIKHAYRAILPHLGQSDPLSLPLFPAYAPSSDQQSQVPESSKLGQRALCPSCRSASSTLSGIASTKETRRNTQRLCFFTIAVLTTSQYKNGFGFFPNQKPWMSKEFQLLLTNCNRSFQATRHCTALQEASYKEALGAP